MALLTQRPITALTEVTFVQTRDSLCRVGDQRLAGNTSSASGGLLDLYSHHAKFMKDLPLLGELGNTSSFRDFLRKTQYLEETGQASFINVVNRCDSSDG